MPIFQYPITASSISGVVSGTGTTGTLAKFTAAGAIGNSIATESTTILTVSNTVNAVTGYQVNSTALASTHLSDVASLATLTGSQALTNKTISSFLSGTVTVSGSGDTLSITGVTSTLGLINEGATQVGQSFEVTSALTTSPRGLMSSQYNTGTDGARFHMRKGRGTRGTPTVVVTGDNLGRLVASGYDGANFLENASIIMGTEGTIASTRVPTNIQFLTATDAAPSVLTEAMRINSAQNIGIGTGATISAAFHITRNGALSTGNGPAMKLDGTWITGGSATTTKPYALIEPAGTTSTAWSTSGTGLGVNSASGFGGRLLDLQVAALTKFYVDQNGAGIFNSYVSASNIIPASTGLIQFGGGGGRSVIISTANGNLSVQNNAQNDFGLFIYGLATSSFPALKRSTTGLIARLADDSADTWFQGKSMITSALTVATLPGSPVAGERAFVTDSNAASFTLGIGAVVAAGGSTAVPVVYDGAAWRIG